MKGKRSVFSSDDAIGLLQERRNILRLGVAGLPMMFTLQASAQSAVISQLRCTMTIPCGYAALIDTSGKVYLANKGWNTAPKLSKNIVEDFKSGADFIFPAGTAPSEYLPENKCDEDIDNRTSGSTGLSRFQDDETENPIDTTDDVDEDNIESIYERARNFRRNRFRRHQEGKNNDKKLDCEYTIVVFPCDDTFQMSEVVSAGGAWSASGLRAFWLDLARSYTQEFNTDKGFPGVSCLVSVLNFINTK